jgi:hypothetical protein
MNTILWILQIILCIKFLSVAYSHGVQPNNAKIEQSKQKLGGAGSLLHKVFSAVVFLDSIALVLPGIAPVAAWIMIPAAALLTILILCSIVLHRLSREKPLIVADIVLLAMAVFVLLGRWMFSPL